MENNTTIEERHVKDKLALIEILKEMLQLAEREGLEIVTMKRESHSVRRKLDNDRSPTKS